MAGEQYESCTEGSSVPAPVPEHVYKVGIYGWRKRCLYLFVLLLVIILVVNLALTIWIFRVMWFNSEGMGLLQVDSSGVKLDKGESDFLLPLYAEEIHSRDDSPLLVHSDTENVYLNARDENGDVTGRMSVGPRQAEGYTPNLLLTSSSGEMLFSADGKQAAIGPDKLRITGPEGALFQHSVEVPLLKSELFKDLKLESPTRSLTMDAPKGVHLKALAGNIEAASNMDVILQSSVGLLVLDAETVRMVNLPQSQGGVSGNADGLFEVCVCPSGKLFLSKAGVTSTCSDNQEC
ncbi:gamma-sarcoglycan [Hippocampus zosterae]|uniref:gamma-sarcoglycan n=1 Tax=Hippocampus zosterae TaxID=109293 RepID=UPI00223D5196|nr:gamma-sarcoglycan [Hippocampus zosterae]